VPLGKRSAPFAEPPVSEPTERYGVTPAQVILRWHLQRRSLPLPKSATPQRQRQNLDLFGFELTDAEVDAITALARPDGRLFGGDRTITRRCRHEHRGEPPPPGRCVHGATSRAPRSRHSANERAVGSWPARPSGLRYAASRYPALGGGPLAEADQPRRREARAVLTLMTWNVENFFAPQPADRAAYDARLAELAEVIRTAAPDLLALQEVGDEQPFEALRNKLVAGWTGVLSTHFETPHTIRVGWLSPGDLSDVEEVVHLPAALSPVEVADDGTTLARLGRGALAVTYTTAGGMKSGHSTRI
jgi:aldo/keto reductase family protein/endonuclease/exonuclease/phosphatase family protein